MGWRMWSDRDQGVFGFYCDTTDQAFGPVMHYASGLDRETFYREWTKLCKVMGEMDPRRLSPKQLNYWCTKIILKYDSWVFGKGEKYEDWDHWCEMYEKLVDEEAKVKGWLLSH